MVHHIANITLFSNGLRRLWCLLRVNADSPVIDVVLVRINHSLPRNKADEYQPC